MEGPTPNGDSPGGAGGNDDSQDEYVLARALARAKARAKGQRFSSPTARSLGSEPVFSLKGGDAAAPSPGSLSGDEGSLHVAPGSASPHKTKNKISPHANGPQGTPAAVESRAFPAVVNMNFEQHLARAKQQEEEAFVLAPASLEDPYKSAQSSAPQTRVHEGATSMPAMNGHWHPPDDHSGAAAQISAMSEHALRSRIGLIVEELLSSQGASPQSVPRRSLPGPMLKADELTSPVRGNSPRRLPLWNTSTSPKTSRAEARAEGKLSSPKERSSRPRPPPPEPPVASLPDASVAADIGYFYDSRPSLAPQDDAGLAGRAGDRSAAAPVLKEQRPHAADASAAAASSTPSSHDASASNDQPPAPGRLEPAEAEDQHEAKLKHGFRPIAPWASSDSLIEKTKVDLEPWLPTPTFPIFAR